jgi:hypothetical protein
MKAGISFGICTSRPSNFQTLFLRMEQPGLTGNVVTIPLTSHEVAVISSQLYIKIPKLNSKSRAALKRHAANYRYKLNDCNMFYFKKDDAVYTEGVKDGS